MARNRRHKPWVILLTFGASVCLHPGMAQLYEATRSPPTPILRVTVDGEGSGFVSSFPLGIECGDTCSMELLGERRIKLTAAVAEGSTFEGWDGPCGSQAHRLFGWASEVLQVGAANGVQHNAALALFLRKAGEAPLSDSPLECEVVAATSVNVQATFGVPPPLVVQTDNDATMPAEVTRKEPDAPEVATAQEEPESEPEVAPEIEVSIAQVTPKPPPPEVAELPNMKAVEVPDQNEVEAAPDDARFLSDKNRDVKEETRAEDTNLLAASAGEVIASTESTVDSEVIGGEEAEIAQDKDQEATSFEAKRDAERALGSEAGAVVHRGGNDGDEGEDGDGRSSDDPGLLSMRNIDPTNFLGKSGDEAQENALPRAGSGGERGKSGVAGPNLQIDQDAYERIVGQEIAQQEVAVARRTQSRRKGRWERKLGMIKSSLENFTPEVRAGNQTALKTRAAPFAVYIARMHRRIHELWGFGFLEDLNDKSSSNKLNDWSLAVKLEIVINPNGEIDKMTIVRPSGQLPFDVAALDVVDVAGPFEPTPKEIRSPDGKVYMHWSFHRDWRQCGTFGAEPFILSSAPKNSDRVLDDSQLLGDRKGRRRASARSSREGEGAEQNSESNAASARAHSALGAPDDPAARHHANLWLTAFTQGNAKELARLSHTPFRSAGKVVAKSMAELAKVYQNVLGELTSRGIVDWQLLSAAGYRRNFRTLPQGIDPGGQDLFLVVQLAQDRLTLVLSSAAKGYRITGLYR